MIDFFIVFSRYGKIRLQRWYDLDKLCRENGLPITGKDANALSTSLARHKSRILQEIVPMILKRRANLCNILDWKPNTKIIYKKYASLIFCCGVDADQNELIVFDMIHRFVELLDGYFQNVCELDIVYHMPQAYYLLDETFLYGHFVDASKRSIKSHILDMDDLAAIEYDIHQPLNLFKKDAPPKSGQAAKVSRAIAAHSF